MPFPDIPASDVTTTVTASLLNMFRSAMRYFKGLDDDTVEIEAGVSYDGPVRPGRYTTTQRNALTAVEPMMIYNTTVDEIQVYVNGAWTDVRGALPTGEILDWAGTTATIPAGFLECDGSNVSRTTYAALFSAIGTRFGTGDGNTTFGLPDITRTDNRLTAIIKT